MTDLPIPAPMPGPPSAARGPLPAPVDPRAAASAEIGHAVDALEASRSGSLDDQLAAAERVHEVLAGHLGSGSLRS